jgi:hypothetical protein
MNQDTSINELSKRGFSSVHSYNVGNSDESEITLVVEPDGYINGIPPKDFLKEYDEEHRDTRFTYIS